MKSTDILRFLTGCERPPIGGLPDKFKIHFKHGCVESCKCSPVVSLCALTLTVPIHMNSIEDIKTSFEIAVKGSNGFGRL